MYFTRHASHEHASHGHASHRRASYERASLVGLSREHASAFAPKPVSSASALEPGIFYPRSSAPVPCPCFHFRASVLKAYTVYPGHYAYRLQIILSQPCYVTKIR